MSTKRKYADTDDLQKDLHVQTCKRKFLMKEVLYGLKLY